MNGVSQSAKTALRGSLDPEFYKKTAKEKFTINNDLEDIYTSWSNLLSVEDFEKLEVFLVECLETEINTREQLNKALIRLRRKHKKIFKKSHMLYALSCLRKRWRLESEKEHGKKNSGAIESKYEEKEVEALRGLLVKKVHKSTSGVLVVTLITSPYPEVNGKKQKFSCEWNCYYCPNEPGQPRSYLHDEPSVLRANRNNFDPVLQFHDRVMTLYMNGHPIDKIEILILGGTWSSYPVEYQETFIRDIFYAANTFLEPTQVQGTPGEVESGNMLGVGMARNSTSSKKGRSGMRPVLNLSEEKKLNEMAECKIIGVTLETRPDCITAEELRRYRFYGCTRVQLGIQHTDDRILKKINRGCYRSHVVQALKLLKDTCFKIDIHIMPNLPGANPDIDRDMFLDVLYSSDLQADQWKLYPCEVVPWTVIQKWFESGEYVPYKEPDLLEVLKYAKRRVHPWIRLNRVVRDIPSQYILGGVDRPSMRQEIAKIMEKEGKRCRCIRCREVKDKKDLTASAIMKLRMYFASGGLEYFISFETPDEETIFGFARLRIPSAYLDLEKDRVDIAEIEKASGIARPAELRGRGRETKEDDLKGKKAGKRARTRSRQRGRRNKSGGKGETDESQFEVPFPELANAGLIRELHVYGKLLPALVSSQMSSGWQGASRRQGSKQQHVGFGTKLMQEAERLCRNHHKINRVAVISGVGVRQFYRKLGYELRGEGEMLIKELEPNSWLWEVLNRVSLALSPLSPLMTVLQHKKIMYALLPVVVFGGQFLAFYVLSAS